MLSVSILSIGAVSKNQSTSNRFTIFHYYFSGGLWLFIKGAICFSEFVKNN